jgi:5-methylcytosine-specific restriction endonuclease McrA
VSQGVNLRRCKLASGPYKRHHRRCDWCGRKLPKRRRRWCSQHCANAFLENHYYSRARIAAKKRDKYQCVKCGAKRNLEINHIIPVLGKHNKHGCWHHLTNLETLCHKCHLIVTKQQWEQGLLKH